MDLISKAKLITAFSHENSEKTEYSDFFEYNDLGVPLAIALSQGHINLRSAGEEVLLETWSDLCEVLRTDPDRGYESIEELFEASRPGIDIQHSIELNNKGHNAFISGNARQALDYWNQASLLGQPNAINSLVWLNIMLNKFDQLDSILFDQPDLGIPGYGDRTENWRAQFDALTGDPAIGASQFDSQKEMIFCNSALSTWLSGDENRALAFLVLAGDGAEAKFLRATMNSVPVSEMELDESQVAELISIYEKGIENFERIKSLDASLIQPWDGMTFVQFATESIANLKSLNGSGK